MESSIKVGIPNEDIFVILSASACTRNLRCSNEQDFLQSTYPDLNIKSNFAFDGMDSKVVIVIRNGGLLSFSLSNAISRAVTKLISFIHDDHEILERCCKKGLLVKQTPLEYITLSEETQEISEIESSYTSEESSSPSSPEDHMLLHQSSREAIESIINNAEDNVKPAVTKLILDALKMSKGTNCPKQCFDNSEPQMEK